jgi:hypothetical protein
LFCHEHAMKGEERRRHRHRQLGDHRHHHDHDIEPINECTGACPRLDR